MNTKDKQSRGKIAAALRAAFPFTILFWRDLHF